MENFFIRYKNPMVLMTVLLIQVVVLATQVKRPENSRSTGGTRLIRVWTMTGIAPFERGLLGTGHFFRNVWRNYIDLHNVRKQNRQLQEELERLRLEQVRLRVDAGESQRLRALLEFKERYVGQTLAAEVIGTSGSDFLHTVTIDKGSHDGVKPDMAVITANGVVGKVKEVSLLSSQVLMINDRESGAGVILQGSRLQGILRGIGHGELQISYVMSDEKVDVGEQVVTSGGDRVYPKGFPVGVVTKVSNDTEGGPFFAIKVKPAANLNRLEEVLVVIKIAEEAPVIPGDSAPQRAAEILAARLPSVPKAADAANTNAHAEATAPTASGNPAAPQESKPKSLLPPAALPQAGETGNAGVARVPSRPRQAAKPSPSPTPGDITSPDNSQVPSLEPKKSRPPAANPEKPPR